MYVDTNSMKHLIEMLMKLKLSFLSLGVDFRARSCDVTEKSQSDSALLRV